MKQTRITKNILILLILLNQAFMQYQANLSSDFIISSEGNNEQSYPAIATLGNGNIVAVWDSQTQSDHDIIAQIFDSAFYKVGKEIQVKTGNGNQTMPFVIDLRSKNRMAFFWQDKTTGDICLKIFDYDGTPVSEEIKANTFKSYYAADDANIRVAVNSLGNFFMTWQIEDSLFSTWDVRGRLFNSSGSPLTDDFKVNDPSEADQSRPSVCAFGDDNFVVTYHGLQSGNLDVYFKIFDSTAKNVLKSETMAHPPNHNEQSYPYCARTAIGGFVIAFATKSWGNDYDLALQSYDNDGNSYDAQERKINKLAVKPWVTIASFQSKGYVVAYSSVNDEVLYQVHLVGADDGPLDFPEKKAASTLDYKQTTPFVSTFDDFRFVLAWEFNNLNGTNRKGIGLNSYNQTAECSRLQIYTGRMGLKQIFSVSQFPYITTIKVTKNPKYGNLYDPNGNKLDNTSFYPPSNIYYKPTLNSDTFEYILNTGGEPCTVDIYACYLSCGTCSMEGNSDKHSCDSCLTEDDYYNLSDNISQCYKKTDIINGYEFNPDYLLFMHSSAGYYYNNYNTTYPYPSTTNYAPNYVYRGDISVGSIAIVIIIPLLVIALGIFIICMLCRKRRANMASQGTQTIEDQHINTINASRVEMGPPPIRVDKIFVD
jgi:hypothetical protein